MKFRNETHICGLDEAGRGALAGPLVAAGVLWPWKTLEAISRNVGFRVRDSKLLTAALRKRPSHSFSLFS
ncbi:hypothetical protein M1555_01000 [Patescibacteria group bacterium]|nr:hypothetical protein [Patescibacteria group bacterium]